MKSSQCYDDMIDLPYPQLRKRKSMSLYARSAQFAPFSALSGWEEMIDDAEKENMINIDKK